MHFFIAQLQKKLRGKKLELPDYYLTSAFVEKVIESINQEQLQAIADVDEIGDIVAKTPSQREVMPRPEFEQRYVMGIKGLTNWTVEEIDIQKNNNRILQLGYSTVHPDEIIHIARTAKMDWLTDFVCPTPLNACKLNIAADLITYFKVSSNDLNEIVDRVFNFVISQDPNFLNKIQSQIDLKLKSDVMLNLIKEDAQQAMKIKYPMITSADIKYNEILSAFERVETERAKKKISHELLQVALSKLHADIQSNLHLELKETHFYDANEDISMLGAPGSGKSTISRDLLSEEAKRNYVMLATDDYRGVVLDSSSEATETDQVFVRTQDTAYTIKELVKARLESTSEKRPNVFLDCVSLESWHQELLSTNKQTLSCVACVNDISIIPLRAFDRAINSTNPADKGRQIHTSELLKSHALASTFLLTSIPAKTETILYDTNVNHKKPVPMGRIDTREGKHDIDVYELSRLGQFLCKANVNTEATFKGELFRDTSKTKYRYTYDNIYQAEQVLNLLKPYPPIKNDSYKILLKADLTSEPYAEIILDKDNNIRFEVKNPDKLLFILNNNGEDAKIIRCIAMQILWKSQQGARENVRVLGRDAAERVAIQKIIPEIVLVPSSMRKQKNALLFQRFQPESESKATGANSKSESISIT
jgi:hypothetical protein